VISVTLLAMNGFDVVFHVKFSKVRSGYHSTCVQLCYQVEGIVNG